MTQAPPPPRHYWLWHLAALQVIEATFDAPAGAVPDKHVTALRGSAAPQITGTLWDSIPQTGSATIALIDTGVSRLHPNLVSRVDAARSIDLTSHRYGARHLGVTPGDTSFGAEGKARHFAGLNIDTLAPLYLETDEAAYLQALVADYRNGEGVLRHLAEPENTFAAHGTACAGLMVGEPAAVAAEGQTAQQPPDIILAGGAINPALDLLPYCGVDPFSQVLSVRTAFEDDPHHYIAAFLYAWSCGVDVIVLPRGLPDPVRARLQPKPSLTEGLKTFAQREAADLKARLDGMSADPDPTAPSEPLYPDRGWKILRHLIIAISRHIPVVCPAGNDGESQLIYPACLAEPGNGIIAVGAVTAEGFRSGYSNYGDGLTVVAPSDDGEVLNRHQLRIDRTDPLTALHDYTPGKGAEIVHCPLELVTTDLPGIWGYAGGGGQDPAAGGLYTAFGGTSGAAALIGGLLALAQRARKAANLPRQSGDALKHALVKASNPDAVVAPGYRPLCPDPMNADDETGAPKRYFFGAGLPDARILIAAMQI